MRRIRQPHRLGSIKRPPRPLFRGTSISEYFTDFDGSTEYVRIDADVFDFDRLDTWSAMWWMRKTGGGITNILGRDQNASPFRGWAIQCRGGLIAVQLINTFSTNLIEVRSTGFTFFTGSWKMGLVTYSGSSTAAGVQIYAGEFVGGIPTFRNVTDPTPVFDTLTATISEPTARFAAMARYDTVNGAGAFTSEDLGDVRVFPGRVLTAAEGAELYAAGAALDPDLNQHCLDNNVFSQGGDCELWWRMGDGDAGASYGSGSLRDYSGQGNDGTSIALSAADVSLGTVTGDPNSWPRRMVELVE